MSTFQRRFKVKHHFGLDFDCSESSFSFTEGLPSNSLISVGEELSCNSCQQNNHKIPINHQDFSRSSSVHFAADISVSAPWFVAVLILYKQDSSVKRSYNFSKGIKINEKTLHSQREI